MCSLQVISLKFCMDLHFPSLPYVFYSQALPLESQIDMWSILYQNSSSFFASFVTVRLQFIFTNFSSASPTGIATPLDRVTTDRYQCYFFFLGFSMQLLVWVTTAQSVAFLLSWRCVLLDLPCFMFLEHVLHNVEMTSYQLQGSLEVFLSRNIYAGGQV